MVESLCYITKSEAQTLTKKLKEVELARVFSRLSGVPLEKLLQGGESK